jgi:hypothetical protein
MTLRQAWSPVKMPTVLMMVGIFHGLLGISRQLPEQVLDVPASLSQSIGDVVTLPQQLG